MRPISKQRLLIVFPVLFAIVGGWLIDFSIALRTYFAPAPGVVIGVVVLVVAAMAARQLWVGRRRATLAVFFAGVAATAAVVAIPFLFPVVEAAGDPSDFTMARNFYTALSIVVGLTIVGTWLTHIVGRSLRSNS
jgi:uncharacterized membrane protein